MNRPKIKICGLRRKEDIEAVNEIKPDLIGFVFVKGRKRYVSFEKARILKADLSRDIKAVGVFINEDVETVAKLVNDKTIDIAQLHGDEDNDYIDRLRELTGESGNDRAPESIQLIRAFQIRSKEDIIKAEGSHADMILLDSGTGSGEVFDWQLLKDVKRPFFLAGGLDITNIEKALNEIEPYGVDVSSGVETEGFKDRIKMTDFVGAVRKERKNGR